MSDKQALIDEVIADLVSDKRCDRATATALLNRLYCEGMTYDALMRASLERLHATRTAVTASASTSLPATRVTGSVSKPPTPAAAERTTEAAKAHRATRKPTERRECEAPGCKKHPHGENRFCSRHRSELARATEAANRPATTVVTTTPADSVLRVMAIEEFEKKYLGARVFKGDPWTARVIEELKTLPMGGVCEVVVPERRSHKGFRDKVSRVFKKAQFRISLYQSKDNPRQFGVRKMEKQA